MVYVPINNPSRFEIGDCLVQDIDMYACFMDGPPMHVLAGDVWLVLDIYQEPLDIFDVKIIHMNGSRGSVATAWVLAYLSRL